MKHHIPKTGADGQPYAPSGTTPSQPAYWLASFGASHWDALAIGRTRVEASTALIAEVMRQYPGCTFTDDEWAEDMYVRPISVPFAEVS